MARILSTKKLRPNQRELLLNAGASLVEYDAIQIEFRDFTLPRELEHIIITSQNGAKAVINAKVNPENSKFYCVGGKTTALLVDQGYNVIATGNNGLDLGSMIVAQYKDKTFHYFCGKQRREELPNILSEAGITCNEVVVYETHLNERSFDQQFDGVLFFSPSGVSAFAKANSLKATAFCIGETTATEAQTYFEKVIISNATTIESTIAKAVNFLKKE